MFNSRLPTLVLLRTSHRPDILLLAFVETGSCLRKYLRSLPLLERIISVFYIETRAYCSTYQVSKVGDYVHDTISQVVGMQRESCSMVPHQAELWPDCDNSGDLSMD